jgi:hypothetical protein
MNVRGVSPAARKPARTAGLASARQRSPALASAQLADSPSPTISSNRRALVVGLTPVRIL